MGAEKGGMISRVLGRCHAVPSKRRGEGSIEPVLQTQLENLFTVSSHDISQGRLKAGGQPLWNHRPGHSFRGQTCREVDQDSSRMVT
jgi:hypothetical protein